VSFRQKLSSFQHRLPDPLQRLIRRRYYLGVVQKYRESDWEWSLFIKPLVAPGSTVLDIGANVGYLTGLFARFVGPQGRVIAVEPIPRTFDALSSSMKKLYPGQVMTIQSCISDKAGEVTMSVPDYAGGGTNYYESRIVEKGNAAGKSYTVKATSLDDLVTSLNLTLNHNPNPGLGRLALQGMGASPSPAIVSLIKIDVEGHELSVIRGASGFLSRHQPPLLIEVAGDPDEPSSNASRLFTVLAQYGYAPHLIKNGKLLARSPGDQSVDYLFLIST